MSAVIEPAVAAARVQAIRALLAEVADPEIPVLSVVD
jgi:metal-sulfur cluster biosynthetic enzyme